MPSARIVSLITGAGAGIGAALAQLLASNGHDIVINFSNNEEGAKKTATLCRALGASVSTFKADISKLKAAQALVDHTIAYHGKIDHLINNAGITVFSDYKNLASQTAEVFEKIFSVNLYGAFAMSQCAAPYLKISGSGTITNISSAAGLTGIGSSIAYATSKGALNTLTLSLAHALAPEIRVNAICPAVVASTWWEKRFTDPVQLDAFHAKQSEASPIKHLNTPLDIAKTVLFLIENNGITGEILRLNAGVHIGAANAKKELTKLENNRT